MENNLSAHNRPFDSQSQKINDLNFSPGNREQPANFNAMSRAIAKELQQLASLDLNQAWKLKDKGEVTIHMCKNKVTGLPMSRGEITINHPIERVCSNFYLLLGS
eukprot:TRINITY_DN3096_c0_g1_i2.p1 TRINITY_DN3096_c0_g1~~TRINITY_DN3096_c0_g1_i2.p1  ORF type:complete len:105 (+),score=13.15 TRINITY_DN3096_c0_g1_i2:158-472(+)